MPSLAQRREDIHRAIRHQQIEAKFSHHRLLLKEVDQEDVIGIINHILKSLQRALEIGDEEAITTNLTQLHNVAIQYLIIDFLLLDVKFPVELEAVRNGSLPLESTWVDLFVTLLGVEQEGIQEEASALVYHSLFQIRLRLPDKRDRAPYEEQVLRVLQQLPLKLLTEGTYKVILSMLDSLQELLRSDNSHQVVPFLLSMNPDLLQTIAGFFKSPQIGLREYAEKVLDISLLILFVTSQIQYFEYLPEIIKLKELAKGAILAKIYNEELSTFLFSRILILCRSKVALEYEQLEFLLRMTLPKQLEQKNIEYLYMIREVIHSSDLFILADSLKYFTNALFSAVNERSEEQLNFRQCLAVIVYRNVQVFREMVQDNIQSAIGRWEDPDFTECFSDLVKVAYDRSEGLFTLLLEICFNLYEALPHLGSLLNRKLSFLSRHKEWIRLVDHSPHLCQVFLVE